MCQEQVDSAQTIMPTVVLVSQWHATLKKLKYHSNIIVPLLPVMYPNPTDAARTNVNKEERTNDSRTARNTKHSILHHGKAIAG